MRQLLYGALLAPLLGGAAYAACTTEDVMGFIEYDCGGVTYMSATPAGGSNSSTCGNMGPDNPCGGNPTKVGANDGSAAADALGFGAAATAMGVAAVSGSGPATAAAAMGVAAAGADALGSAANSGAVGDAAAASDSEGGGD
jgi:hypothetical protein